MARSPVPGWLRPDPVLTRRTRALLALDLVVSLLAAGTELVRVVVYPVVLGAGERLFGETAGAKAARLVDCRTIGAGLAFLTYRFGADA